MTKRPNGAGSVYVDAAGRVRGALWIDGRRRLLSGGTREEMEQRLERLRIHSRRPRPFERRPPSEGEHLYRDLFARQLGGETEVAIRLGRVDVATNAWVVEVEPVGSWRHGARQALVYGAVTGKRPVLAVYGVVAIKTIERIRDNGLLFDLFVLDGLHWVRAVGLGRRWRPFVAATPAEVRRRLDVDGLAAYAGL